MTFAPGSYAQAQSDRGHGFPADRISGEMVFLKKLAYKSGLHYSHSPKTSAKEPASERVVVVFQPLRHPER